MTIIIFFDLITSYEKKIDSLSDYYITVCYFAVSQSMQPVFLTSIVIR